MRPGFGLPHPVLEQLVASTAPMAEREVSWMDGAIPLRVRAYAGRRDLPDELITSVRSLVRVGNRVVYCENDEGGHPWPGGRRQAGESLVATAVREVYEETGWQVQAASVSQLGWLHFTHLAPLPQGYQYPYPDFIQVVTCGDAQVRSVGDHESWADIDGFERNARLLPVDQVRREPACDPLSLEFLGLISAL